MAEAEGARTAAVGAWPAVAGSVLTPTPHRAESLSDYREAGGYALLEFSANVHDELVRRPDVELLRGRGGAAFPFLAKVASVRAAARGSDAEPCVVANGAEGEPLSVKDRYLMRHRPHLVLDGVALAAAAVGARTAYLYVSDDLSSHTLEQAGRDAVSAGLELPALEFVHAQDTFVAGEASAAVRAITTRVARPRDNVRRLSTDGVAGAPTLVSNVETLGRLARAVMPTPCEGESPFLVTVSGSGSRPWLVEVPNDLAVGDLLDYLGLSTYDTSVLVGGFFGGILPVAGDLRISVSSMEEHGGALGCASLYVISSGEDPVAVGAAVARYYSDNNARQCRSCVNGTRAVADVLEGELTDVSRAVASLTRWSDQLVGRGACAVPDGVAVVLRSLLRHYPDRLHGWLTEQSFGPARTPARWDHLTVGVPTPLPNDVTGSPTRGITQLEVVS